MSSSGGGTTVLTIVMALGGAAGVGAFLREGFTGVIKTMHGFSSRESTRHHDLVTQRNNALIREQMWREALDTAERNRRRCDEYVATLRLKLMERGLSRDNLPERPVYEDTMGGDEIKSILERGTK